MRKILTIAMLLFCGCDKTPAVTCGTGTKLVGDACVAAAKEADVKLSGGVDSGAGSGGVPVMQWNGPLFCSPFEPGIPLCAPARDICEVGNKTCAPYDSAFCFSQIKTTTNIKGWMCTPTFDDCETLRNRFSGRDDVRVDKRCSLALDTYEYGIGSNAR